jgi:plasmid stabilization system protein ParE
MTRYVLAPEAAADLVQIWKYLRREAGDAAADRIESEILSRFVYLAEHPGLGHFRRDLTSEPVRFFSIYSWLIVYRPQTKPLQVISILHGRRDLSELLSKRLT